jgi:hypothetical protein
LRPNEYALRASRRRSASVNRSRRPPRRSFSSRFSSLRYSITSTCWRLIQPASRVTRNCRGWMERNIVISIPGYSSSSAAPPRPKRAVRIVGYYGRSTDLAGRPSGPCRTAPGELWCRQVISRGEDKRPAALGEQVSSGEHHFAAQVYIEDRIVDLRLLRDQIERVRNTGRQCRSKRVFTIDTFAYRKESPSGHPCR